MRTVERKVRDSAIPKKIVIGQIMGNLFQKGVFNGNSLIRINHLNILLKVQFRKNAFFCKFSEDTFYLKHK